jgi:NADH-quinone oxidoreductase subunit N
MLLAAVKQGHQFWLVIIAVLCAAISAYYYFKIIQAMYFKTSDDDQISAPVGNGFKYLLIITALLIIVLGILPGMLIGWLYV